MNETRQRARRGAASGPGTELVMGVLGGMGPEATVDFFAKVVRRTAAKNDREHLRIIIDNNPKVPDRTAAILAGGESPIRELVRSARALEKAGADFIVIPCVTVHHFHAELQSKTKLPVLHIVKETVRELRRRVPGISRVGLLATTGTIRAGLFHKALRRTPTQLIVPPDDVQRDKVMAAIYGIKSGGSGEGPRQLVRKAAEGLIAGGAEAIIAGCTEIPLVLGDGDLPVPVIDTLSALAEAAIRRAGGRTKD
ncbi:MAG: aspartate/glutamate racemase family protein [Vicinamibacterales bacterium]